MSKRNDTDPMGFALQRPRTTQPMLVAPAPPTPTPPEDLTATTEEASSPPPSKPALSKAEIRSIFQDLSDGLGDPTSRAAVPASEIAQYAEPHALRAKNKTPVLEPPIVVRKSVQDELLPSQTARVPALERLPGPLYLKPDAAPERRAPRAGNETVRMRPLGTSTRARIGAAVAGAAVVLAIAATLAFQKPEPENVSPRALTPGPSPARAEGSAANVMAVPSVPSGLPTAAAPAPSQDGPREAAPGVHTTAAIAAPAAPPRARVKPAQPVAPSAPSTSSTALPYDSLVNQERK